MAIRRYARAPILRINQQYGTSKAIQAVRDGIASGQIRFTDSKVLDGQRLDSIAGDVYGNATYGWIIAAASEIGWTLQVPPETRIRIPNLDDVENFVG